MNTKQNQITGLIITLISSIMSIQFSWAISTPINIINNTNDTDIYQDKDKYGNITLTNKPSHSDAKKINLPPLTIYERPMTQKDINIKNADINYNNDNNSNSNILQPNNQRGREYVLQEELSKEITALHEAMSMLDYNKKLPIPITDARHQEQLKIIEDAIHEHQKNIALLNSTLH